MNVLVTVGTTPFNSLFRAIDQSGLPEKFNLLGQTAGGQYQPKRFKCFDFDPEFSKHLQWADTVVTHAGAGNVYKLLELGKKCVVVANLERIDTHQTDLTRYVSENNYALATNDVEEVVALVEQVGSFTPNCYKKTDFFVANEIRDLIIGQYQLK